MTDFSPDLGLSSYLEFTFDLLFLILSMYFSQNLPGCLIHSRCDKCMFLNACFTLKAVGWAFHLRQICSSLSGGGDEREGAVPS